MPQSWGGWLQKKIPSSVQSALHSSLLGMLEQKSAFRVFFSHAVKKNLWEGPAYVLTQNQDIQLLVRDTSRASSNFATLPKAGKMP